MHTRLPTIDHPSAKLLTGDTTLVLGDFNGHNDLWHSTNNDARGNLLADVINASNFGVLNQDTPTRLPNDGTATSPDISLASDEILLSTSWHTSNALSSDHLPITITLQLEPIIKYAVNRRYVNSKKANWTAYTEEVEEKLIALPPPTSCHKGEKIFSEALRKAAAHNIPTGRHKLDTEPRPAEILTLIAQRDTLREADPTSPQLPALNRQITATIAKSKKERWVEHVESFDHRTNSSRLWRTIQSIDGKSVHTADNESISFNKKALSSPADIAKAFNKQFTTSKTGPHKSSKDTRQIIRNIQKGTLDNATVFTTGEVAKAIKSCKNSKAFGPDDLTIFHLKHLGPVALTYLTAMFNDSVSTSRIPAIWKTSTISSNETSLTRFQRATLCQLRSGYCRLLNSYRHRLDPNINNCCDDCGGSPHDVPHLFNCPAHPTTLTPLDLWTNPSSSIQHLHYLHPDLDISIDGS